ncbi:MAG: DNA repair protein RadA [Smithellaceae bacterium]|nr:DNA repair protein RadA [Smithellaceae bacterium]MDD3258505.1 DNA repair protein RadA [Smithellaceae bacterium]MDD3847930.1 DNA repair protein RadA [Smithellaceae bacterium]HOG12043.1 DNA repair protein RadA [Smithellaceae bacterium]HPL09746.1 DNA repair protein RadA [Smithellaceae bacterium]
MKKSKTSFFCQHCGYMSPKWLGKCPSCSGWNCFAEELVTEPDSVSRADRVFGGKPMPIFDIPAVEGERTSTGIVEVDRVLGGGIVSGSAILIGGEPGIGKSTLMLQVMKNLAMGGRKVLYVSGEESASQIKLRADRIGAQAKDLLVLVEVSLEKILEQIRKTEPAMVVIDSVQTVYSSDLMSAPGSVGQVREASSRLILAAKKSSIPVFLVGHVTKDGSIAGPKVLEHMVDTVLYFEGDSGHAYRIVRSMKNRFGPANEIGVFEMRDRGLQEVPNPSAFFLAERPENAPGSVVLASLEGTRPILVEIQALVSQSNLGMPRRTAIGVDHNRVSLLVAVLDKICGLHLGGSDIFLNVAGGVRVEEPAVDLAVVSAMASSFLDRPVDARTVILGEVGLTGEVRAVSQIETRVKEAARLGFNRCIVPKTNIASLGKAAKMEIQTITSLKELLDILF